MALLRIATEDTLSLTWTGRLKWRIDQWTGSYWSGSVERACVSTVGGAVDVWNKRDHCPEAIRNLSPHRGNCWTTWQIRIGGLRFGAEPGEIIPEDRWMIAWVEEEEDPPGHFTGHYGPVTTPFGELAEVPVTFTITIGNLELRTERTAPYAPTGVGARGARKPEDYRIDYGWYIREGSYRRTEAQCDYFLDENGENTPEVVYEAYYPEEYWGLPVTPTGGSVYGAIHDGLAGYVYLETELASEAYPVPFDGWDVEVGPGGSAGKIRAWGEGAVCRWRVEEGFDRYNDAPYAASATIGPRYLVNCENLLVTTAPRGALPSLQEDAVVEMCGLRGTVEQWRAMSRENPLILQWTSWAGWWSNWAHDGTPSTALLAPQLNQEWVEETHHNPGDRRIHVDVGGLDWACQGEPYRKLVTLQHLTDLEIFNPSEAEECPATLALPGGITGEWAPSHADFPGLGAGWCFVLDEEPAGYTIEIALRSNMEDRVQQAQAGEEYVVPDGYGPEWAPPPIPECHRIRAAGGWLPEQEPPESRCDWDNFAWLRLVLACTGDWTPEECKFDVGYLQPQVYDNFLSGDARRTGGLYGEPYSVEWGDLHWLEYAITEAEDGEDGNRYVCLLFPANWAGGTAGGIVVPDLRFVRAIRLMLPDSTAGQKVFFGLHLCGPVPAGWRADTDPGKHSLALHAWVPEETEGDDTAGPDCGLSVVTDGKPGARTVCLWKKRTEEGIPYYYYVEGATTGYDLGYAAGWRQVQAELAKQEGFACSEHTDAYLPMCFEDGDPEGPQLWEPASFDIREGGLQTGRLHYADLDERDANAIGIYFAQRVRAVSPPPLRLYELYGLKHLAGGVWGAARLSDRPEPAQAADGVREKTWEWLDESGWDRLGRAYMSEASPLLLWPQVTGQTRVTGLGRTGASTTALKVIDSREFYWAALLATGVAGKGRLWMYTDQYGVAWVAWLVEDSVLVSRLLHQYDAPGPANQWAEPTQIGTVEDAEAVAITGDGRMLRVLVLADGRIWESWSSDRGRTWATLAEVI